MITADPVAYTRLFVNAWLRSSADDAATAQTGPGLRVRRPDPDLSSVDDAGLPAGAEMVNDLGEGPQPHSGADGAPSLGEQGPHLADGTGDGGAVHVDPAGQYVVRGGVTEMHERGEEPVDEHQLVLRARAHSPLPWPGRKLGLLSGVPQRAYLCDEFNDHLSRQAGDPPVVNDRCTRRVPHHTTMIDDQALDVSPLTVHELVKGLVHALPTLERGALCGLAGRPRFTPIICYLVRRALTPMATARTPMRPPRM
jgi:hypothetical protein